MPGAAALGEGSAHNLTWIPCYSGITYVTVFIMLLCTWTYEKISTAAEREKCKDHHRYKIDCNWTEDWQDSRSNTVICWSHQGTPYCQKEV